MIMQSPHFPTVPARTDVHGRDGPSHGRLRGVLQALAIGVAVVLQNASISGLQAAPSTLSSIGVAVAVVRELAAGEFDIALKQLSPEMAKALTKEQLAILWSGLTQQFGPFGTFGSPRLEPQTGFDVVVIPAIFQQRTIDLQLSIKGDRIIGLFVRPHSVAASDWHPPAYVDPTAFETIETRLSVLRNFRLARPCCCREV